MKFFDRLYSSFLSGSKQKEAVVPDLKSYKLNGHTITVSCSVPLLAVPLPLLRFVCRVVADSEVYSNSNISRAKRTVCSILFLLLWIQAQGKNRNKRSPVMTTFYFPLSHQFFSAVFGKSERATEITRLLESRGFIVAKNSGQFIPGQSSRVYRLNSKPLFCLLFCPCESEEPKTYIHIRSNDLKRMTTLQIAHIRQQAEQRPEYGKQIALSLRLSVDWNGVPSELLQYRSTCNHTDTAGLNCSVHLFDWKKEAESPEAEYTGNGPEPPAGHTEQSNRTAITTLQAIEHTRFPDSFSVVHGRFYSPFHRLRKDLRSALLLDGEPIAELFDVTACFVTLTAVLYLQHLNQQKFTPNQDDKKLFDIIHSEDVYSNILSTIKKNDDGSLYLIAHPETEPYHQPISRKTVKQAMMKFLFASPRYERPAMIHNSPVLQHINAWLLRNFPRFHAFITGYATERNSRGKTISKLSADCQELEAVLMFDNLFPALHLRFPDVDFLSLHDGIFCKRSALLKRPELTHAYVQSLFHGAIQSVLNGPRPATTRHSQNHNHKNNRVE